MDRAADDFAASLSSDGVSFDAADAELLRAIAERGSVSAAADRLGRSRARALSRLETLEGAYGSLVERRRGGPGGGGSELTDRGRDLLSRFDRLRAALSGTAGAAETVLRGSVAGATGELAVVETDPGRVRALLVDGDGFAADPTADGSGAPDPAADGDPIGREVHVSLRADAITLHAPDDAPDDDATSARNRFSGTVADLDRGAAVVRVAVDVGAADPLLALVTAESVDRLALRPGDRVVASFKATATRATPVG